MENVGARIKAFRDSRGLTQKDIFQATKGEIKQTSLSAIENNQAKPGFDTLAALLGAYPELSSDWLLRGAGPMLTNGQLPPAVPSEAKPQREGFPATPGTATPQEADFVGRYIKQLEAQVAAAEADKKHLQGVVTELLGKSPASAYAAVSEPTRFEVTGFQAPAARQGKVVAMYPAPAKLAA